MSFSLTTVALEKTTVLPKGVRNIRVKQIATTIREKYDAERKRQALAKPLEKKLYFKDIVNKETGAKKLLLKSFLLNKFSLSESLGQFQAQMAAHVQVTVPLVSYGITDNLTVALAVPFYQANVGVKIDFNTSANAQGFVASLVDEKSNQIKTARDVAYKLNHATDSLNEKLVENGYQKLSPWKGKGLGDIILALKYRFYNKKVLKAASSMGISIPTGRISDPDILNDIPFGSGALSFFTSIISDQNITDWFFINQYVKGTFSFPNIKKVRLITEEESIAVPKKSVDYKLGSKVEAGLSGQLDTSFGLIGGFGYVYERKLSDQYAIENNPKVKSRLEKETDHFTNHIIAKVGYSSLNAFKQKKLPIPAIASVEYKKQLMSKNAAVKDILSFDLALFF